MTDTAGPLAGLTVLDFTRALAGPYATLLLAGLGARVIRIEALPGDGRESAPFYGRDGASLRRQHEDDVSIAHLIRHRGKDSITLNLKHPEAKRVFTDLVHHVDVVVENFSRGTSERLGVGYSAASAVKPDIIYCSLSGFGQEGTPGGGKAMDNIIQALSGIMMTSGMPDDPPIRIGVPFADLNTPLFAVIGILAALHHKQVTGEGQYIDVSMLGVLASMCATEPFDVLERLGVPTRTGPTVPRLAPFGVYPASDGDVVICCAGPGTFERFAPAIGRPDLVTDPDFSSQSARLNNYIALDKIVADWSRQRTIEEVGRIMEEAGIASAPVRTPGQAMRDPIVQNRHEVIPLAHPVYGKTDEVFGPGIPIKFSATPAGLPPAGSPLRAHNNAVYGEMLGYSEDELERLSTEGVI
jgi:crotonobetainyl-CoA:carnitine CoA-transferase CaiB-like acyl-CoA transferase